MTDKDAETTRGLVGLQNLGNTCFMNSALQCLSNTSPMRDFFEDPNWIKQINKSNPVGHGGAVAEAFGDLVRHMWTAPQQLVSDAMSVCRGGKAGCLQRCCPSSSSSRSRSRSRSRGADLWNSVVAVVPTSPVHPRGGGRGREAVKMSINPAHFKSTLSRHCEVFAGYSQHDAQELLLFLLDALHEDLNRVERKPYVENFDFDGRYISYDSDIKELPPKKPLPASERVAAERQWVGHLRRNQSVIVDLFQGQLRSELQCQSCGHRSVKFEAFMNLELPLISAGATDIDSCLREFSKVEKLTGDHQWRCPQCKALCDATKQMTIFSLPNVLVITFKRFLVNSWGQPGGKIDLRVDFPLEGFDISSGVSRDQHGERAMSGASDDDDPLYDLYGVANHFGSTAGGHYTAYCQNSCDKHWYQFDDSRCTRQPASDICTKNAYVLFFRKQKLQSRLGSALEETVRVAADGTKRKGSVHAKQRPSVKHRLESWKKPGAATALGDTSTNLSMHAESGGGKTGEEEREDELDL